MRTHAQTRTHARACAHTLGISLLLLGWQRFRTNPSSFLALRSAPCASSSRTIPYRPAHAAVCRAVPLQRSTPCCNTSAACYVRSAPTRRRHVQSRARAGRATCFALTIPRAARVHAVMAVYPPRHGAAAAAANHCAAHAFGARWRGARPAAVLGVHAGAVREESEGHLGMAGSHSLV